MSYGSGSDSGWKPSAANPHYGHSLDWYRKNGVPRVRITSKKKPDKLKDNDKPKSSRGHGASAPSGPMRASGYGTEGSKKPGSGNHQAAAERRTSSGSSNYSGGAYGHSGGGQHTPSKSKAATESKKVTGGAYQHSGGGQHRPGSKGGAGSTSSSSKKKGYGLQARARSAPMGSYVSYDAGNNPNSGNAAGNQKSAKDRAKRGGDSIYVAKGGDSWGAIAKREGTTVSALQKANKWQMKNRGGVIYRNSKIRLPAK